VLDFRTSVERGKSRPVFGLAKISGSNNRTFCNFNVAHKLNLKLLGTYLLLSSPATIYVQALALTRARNMCVQLPARNNLLHISHTKVYRNHISQTSWPFAPLCWPAGLLGWGLALATVEVECWHWGG